MSDTNMATSTDQNIEQDSYIHISSSQPNPSTSNKRQFPESPDQLPATQKQNSRQIRRRNSIGDLRDLDTKKVPVQRKNITDKVLEALTSPDVLNKIIPVLSEKIGETISSIIETQIKECVDTHVKPLIETVRSHEKSLEDNKQKLCKQFIQIRSLESTIANQAKIMEDQDFQIVQLGRRVSDLEVRIENQEQYSRRTSLRFHNLKVPVNNYGRIIHPVDTDKLVLDVCNNKLGLDLTTNDISRSHVIGKAIDGRSQVIVRFISYRTRNKVYSSKRLLKDDPDSVFITENLTMYRTALVKKLAQLKYKREIYAYWTMDGRIFAMKSQNSRKRIINNYDDIAFVVRSTAERPDVPETILLTSLKLPKIMMLTKTNHNNKILSNMSFLT